MYVIWWMNVTNYLSNNGQNGQKKKIFNFFPLRNMMNDMICGMFIYLFVNDYDDDSENWPMKNRTLEYY